MTALAATMGITVAAWTAGYALADAATSTPAPNKAVGVSSVIQRESYPLLSGLSRATIPDFNLSPSRRVELSLERFDVFTEDARLVAVDETGEHEVARPEVALFRGDVTGEPDSRVFISVSPGMVSGMIRIAGETFILSSGPATAALPARVYSLSNLPEGAIEWRLWECASDQLAQPLRPKSLPSGQPRGSSCRVIQMAIETDWQYRQLLGSQANAQAYAATLFGAVSEIYTEAVNTTFVINYLRIWNTSNDPWTESDSVNQLFQYRDYWVANMGDVTKHLGHFLSGRGLGGGVAWLPGLCSEDYEYGLSGNLGGFFPYPIQDNSSQNWDLMVVAHEIGHNCGGPHSHDMSPPIDGCAFGDCSVVPNGTIMSYCHLCSGGLANVLMEFHPRTINEGLEPLLSDPGVLAACGDLEIAGPEITDHPVGANVCAGSSVTFTVAASGTGLGYQWRKNTINIGGATSSSYTDNNVQPGDMGVYDCVVSSSCGSTTSNSAALSICPGGEPGDLDDDCDVDLADLSVQLANYGATNATPEMGDITGDGHIDLADISLMLSSFGSSCGG